LYGDLLDSLASF